MEFSVKKFGGYINSQNDLIGKLYNVCDDFSYTFSSGTYFLGGEIDCGAWSFVCSLLDGADRRLINYEEITLNGRPVDLSEINKLTFYVGQYKVYRKKSFKSVVKKALKKSKIDCTFSDICKKFAIDEYFSDREMCYLGSRIWRFSSSIGIAANKKIIVFPWMSEKKFKFDFFDIFRILNQEDVITIVPCSEKIIMPNEEKFKFVKMDALFKSVYDEQPLDDYLE